MQNIAESQSDTYHEFLENKSQLGGEYGFEPNYMPDFLYDFKDQWTNSI